MFDSLELGEYPDCIGKIFSTENAIIVDGRVTIDHLYKNDKLIYN